MKYTPEEVMQYVKEEDVKFVRMAFCDVYGRHKNVAIPASELPRAFSSGIAFDASAVAGFGADGDRLSGGDWRSGSDCQSGSDRQSGSDCQSGSDLLLHPDPSTLVQLPWRPQHGRVAHMFCDITHPDGTPFETDTRRVLKETIKRAEKLGYAFDFGSEMEFYLLKLDEYGEPTKIPYDRAGYKDVAPEDKGENIRREICLTLEQMGIQPERSLHKTGPGQNEIDYRCADALTAADHAILFYTMVRTVAAQNGLWADFSPKPFPDEEGSGMHINLSVRNHRPSADLLPQIIAGLLELAELYSARTGTVLSKSGIRHRFVKIMDLADKYQNKEAK
ncbi:MAG: glutamine synthetase beta-grasp domain-containing protein [Oscillibacter sp.]|nr:glutamine synthetase beta-grasp domain-containing protein [Oscillibacter sp.]